MLSSFSIICVRSLFPFFSTPVSEEQVPLCLRNVNDPLCSGLYFSWLWPWLCSYNYFRRYPFSPPVFSSGINQLLWPAETPKNTTVIIWFIAQKHLVAPHWLPKQSKLFFSRLWSMLIVLFLTDFSLFYLLDPIFAHSRIFWLTFTAFICFYSLFYLGGLPTSH